MNLLFKFLLLGFQTILVISQQYDYVSIVTQAGLISSTQLPKSLYTVPPQDPSRACYCTLSGISKLPTPFSSFQLVTGSYFWSITRATRISGLCFWTNCQCQQVITSGSDPCGCPCECKCSQSTNPCPSVSWGLAGIDISATVDNRFCAPPYSQKMPNIFGASYMEAQAWGVAELDFLAYTPDIQGIYYATNATFVFAFAYRNAQQVTIDVAKLDMSEPNNVTSVTSSVTGSGNTTQTVTTSSSSVTCADSKLYITDYYDTSSDPNGGYGPYCGRSVDDMANAGPKTPRSIYYPATGFFFTVFKSGSGIGTGFRLMYSFLITSAATHTALIAPAAILLNLLAIVPIALTRL